MVEGWPDLHWHLPACQAGVLLIELQPSIMRGDRPGSNRHPFNLGKVVALPFELRPPIVSMINESILRFQNLDIVLCSRPTAL